MEPWYASWFDSPFYPMLYKHRDDEEAADFLDRMLAIIQIPEGSEVLDLACGRGRHSRFLNSKGLNVHGVDLSPSSIQEASKFTTAGLTFEVRDMRRPWTEPKFDLALSLFTSFGYFESDEENCSVLVALRSAIRAQGKVVLDVFNSQKVLSSLIEPVTEQRRVGDYQFRTFKHVENGCIVKRIRVENQDQNWTFFEKVRAYTLQELNALIDEAGLEITAIWGDYNLGPFDSQHSDRLIYLMQIKP
jgi:cyclopropane fatty-acyl-phospholipid synthase-like methyltransferase